jgi:hypothetical protein
MANTTPITAINMGASANESGNRSLAAAERLHTRLVGAYIVVVVAAAFLTYAVWKSGNSLSEEVRKSAESRIAEAQKSAAEANERATRLENDAARARMEAEKIKASVSWREIAPMSREQFKTLAGAIPKGRIIISTVSSNAEAANYGQQLSDMLQAAGYEVDEALGSVTIEGPPPTGVILKIKDEKNPPVYAVPLYQALETIGIKVEGQLDETAGDFVELWVGDKPRSE